MGFVSGFAGGVTFTLALAYYTVTSHERTRRAQAAALRGSTRTLNSFFEPQPPPGPTRAELLRAERSSFVENAKDRWNSEIERAVRAIQNANWGEIREKRDETIAQALGDSLEATRHGIEKAETAIGETTPVIKEKARNAVSEGATKTSQIATKTASKAEQLRTEASGLSAGTVDAARGAVRDAVSKGIEKGKELVGKAQDAVGTAVSDVRSKVKAEKDPRSDVERALEERYRPVSTAGLDRSPEELLAERYK